MMYLGLPLVEGRISKSVYLELVAKVQRKLSDWKASQLTIGGRWVMINAVLYALPVYFMSVTLLPKWVIASIDKVRRRFLWHGHKHGEEHRRYISLARWEMTMIPKDYGGIGVRDMSAMNKSLLCKWMWLWCDRNTTWWKEVTIMENAAVRPWDCSNTTTFWKNIKAIASAFTVSVTHVVGDGACTQFWHDNWAGSCLKDECPGLYALQADRFISVQQMVARQGDLVNERSHPHFQHEHMKLMCCLQHLNLTQDLDRTNWVRNSKGTYTVNSMYRFLVAKPLLQSDDTYIWHLQLPLRVSIFTWLLHRNKILTVDNLRKRGFMLVSYCVLCGRDSENGIIFATNVHSLPRSTNIWCMNIDFYSACLRLVLTQHTSAELGPHCTLLFGESVAEDNFKVKAALLIWLRRKFMTNLNSGSPMTIIRKLLE